MPTSEPVFVDTVGWLAALSADDRLHPQATMLWKELLRARRRLVTTDWVLAETGNGLAKSKGRASLAKVIGNFVESHRGLLVRVGDDLFERALEFYTRVEDKDWGLVDCASFILMRDQGILEVLGADHHFEQAGFRCLLRRT